MQERFNTDLEEIKKSHPCWGKKLKLATFAQEGPPLPSGNRCFPLPLKGQQPPPHQIPVKIPGPALRGSPLLHTGPLPQQLSHQARVTLPHSLQ